VEQDGENKEAFLFDQMYLKCLGKNSAAFSLYFMEENLVNHALGHVKNSVENLEG